MNLSSLPRKILILLFCLLIFHSRTNATHLMGGSMTYQYLGMVGGDESFRVTLKIYRYCDASAGGTAPLDASMMLGIYLQDPLNPNNDKDWFQTEILPRISNTFITPPSPGIDCSFNTTVCVEEGIYQATILLPPSAGGYHLMVERCCRNGNIVNLSNPGNFGQTYYCFIPPDPILNSSPQFSDIPVPFICTTDTATIVNNAFDPDGDSLVYSFAVPYGGYSSTGNAIPDPQIDNNPYGWPIPPVLYNPGYSLTSPFGAGGYAYIDSETGLTQYYIPNQGFYVVAIEIREYRNGVLIATIRRDLQLIAIACPVNAVPVLSNAGGAGQTSFTITEGQTICFPVSFVDPNGDSLFLTSSGVVFNGAIINPPASLPNANGNGFVTSQFCWSTECGQAQATPYQFIATVTDNGCPPKITNQIYSIKVNPSPVPPAPAVSINQSPPGNICTGTVVTFTAIPTFGGTSPVYQWQLNGVNVGGNSNTYTSSTLANGDVITVTMTSNSVCVNTFTSVSPPVVMVVNPFTAPSVTIAAVPAGPICAGTNVTFTASPVNGGATPSYQWSVNGVNVGTNSPTYSSSTLTMASTVSVAITSDPACPSANSNVISMVVNPVLTPSVLITSDNSGAICPGTLVTFRAYPTNGGTVPSYQWQVNGVNVGTNSNTYSNSTLNNGDNVTVILTSNGSCLTTPSATSNIITIPVTTPTAPTVSITSNPSGPICAGDNVIFTATPSFGGASPTYQWQVNGINVGATGSIWSTSGLTNGSQVNVVMTSSLACITTTSAVSNIISVTVNPIINVTASISVSPGVLVCVGDPVTFTANVTNGGTNPSYQWQVNGVNTGPNSATFTSSTLANQDVIRVIVTSNMSCVSPTSVISNPITITVRPIVNPTVSIVNNPVGPVCQGTNITFTASQTSGGPSPVFQWTVNGNPVGSNSTTYSSASLNNGDVVMATLTSNAACPVPPVVSSNQIVAQINPTLVPAVSITAAPAWPVCDGTPVTFTASPVNEGSAPVYQWKVNGVTVPGNSPVFTTSTLNDGDTIFVRLVSNALCASPIVGISNEIIADILPNQIPVISINIQPSITVCDGDSMFFGSSTLHGGSNPVYQWFVNGSASGTNSNSFAGVFSDKDSITAVMTSSYQCAVPPTDTSNLIVVHILPNLTPDVSISVNPTGPVCPGDLLTFTATVTNGGTAPVYNWAVNGATVVVGGSVFNSTTLQDGDVVTVQITSNETCLVTPFANSNAIVADIRPNITPQISISVSPPLPACDQDTLTFTAVFTGGGPVPDLAWRVNGIANGITDPVFITNQLANNDVVDVILISSAFCALPLTDTSNAIQAIIDPLLTPVAIISANPPGTFCDGMEITYSAIGFNGGTQPAYQWLLNGVPVGTNNDTLISSDFLNGDTLQLVYTSNERCLALNPALSNQIIIDRLPPLEPLIIAPDEICEGKEVTMEVTTSGGNGGPYYYNWDSGFGSDTQYTFIPGQTATYTVMVSDSCSTPRYASKTIVVHPLPVPAFIPEPPFSTILDPYFTFTDASVNTVSWFWLFGDNSISMESNPVHTYENPGYYTVELIVTSADGCIDSTSRTVYVEDVVTFYVPNSFTPNNDGVNDTFGVTGHAMSGYNLTVYGRWGQAIFKSKGPFDAWDGNDDHGKALPEGVYVYTVSVNNDPKKKTFSGTVTLIR